jgi:hypothetical protein
MHTYPKFGTSKYVTQLHTSTRIISYKGTINVYNPESRHNMSLNMLQQKFQACPYLLYMKNCKARPSSCKSNVANVTSQTNLLRNNININYIDSCIYKWSNLDSNINYANSYSRSFI